MSERKVKDAKDLETGEKIYFKGHAKATYMSDGTTVEDAINQSMGGLTFFHTHLHSKGTQNQTGTRLAFRGEIVIES